MDSLGRNITLPIYNADGTSFHGLELKKFTFDTIVMALGDKITGELYYTTNTLMVAQTEYVVYEGVKYYLINPPTIVKEGMKSDNGQAKGMTKYSFTFYHPMFMLNNFPFTDVAVTSNEQKYKSQDKTFYWIGNLVDYVAKLNKNLSGTEWVVEIGSNVPVQDKNKLSEVMQFDKQTMADAVKRGYDTWEIPYVIDNISSTDSRYAQGKRFLVRYGLPIQDILVNNEPYVFQMGQGVGLKNDSRTPKNNKIVTRIAGFGSEDNVPFGYPQIIWTGNQSWNYTINNSSSAANSYPIYDGIVAGQRVRLIHHPFTRSHLMPTIYADTVNKKVNPYATGYDPTIEIKDYYDAVNDGTWNYPNQIIQNAPSYEIHEFSDIKPELGNKYLGGASAFDGDAGKDYLTVQEGLDQLMDYVSETNIDVERQVLKAIYDKVNSGTSGSGSQEDVRYTFSYVVASDTNFTNVKLVSTNLNFTMEVHRTNSFPSAPWDDSMDDDGNYKQSYFNIILPSLGFDVYACAAVTQEMKINMRSGACLGCSFPIEVDWEDYKKNFYDSDGNFAPTGSQRDYTKYPDSTSSSITVICKKELETFGTLMPNIYQQPATNDKFVILGISLPTSYITSAQSRLDGEMKQYMLDNNVHYFEYPLKFDEYFLATHTDILSQMKPNILVRFNFAGTTHALYIKQLSVKYGEKPLPQYNITLTDDVEIVLSPIGKVTDEVSSIRVLLGGGGSGGGDVSLDMLSEYFLSKKDDDTAAGMIRLLRGLQVGENFVTGLLGEGGIFRVDEDGTTYLEADKLYIRMRAYFDTVEVKKYLHSGGNRIASKAGINCSRVEWIDANGDVTNVLGNTVKFRCYFRATGDDGHKITNDFVVNDLAFCKETNVDTTSVDQHGYWRCVIAVSSSPTQDGEHWIDLSKTDCLTGSDIPIAQDDIIQLGNKTDTTRQGAIVEFVGGEDAPAYQIYQGINSYDLTGKNYVRFGYDSQNDSAQAYIGNPDGSTYLWYHYVTEEGVTFPRLDIKANVTFISPTTGEDTTIEDFAEAVDRSISDLQEQIDGELDTWYYSGVPTLLNVPASTWTTDQLKKEHIGDLYYDKDTGYVYRFIYDTSVEPNEFKWIQIHDDAISEALRLANDAQDTADSKRRVFYTTPTPPYDNGDLWVNAVWPSSGEHHGETYNNDILRCVTSKPEEGLFAIGDWTLASKYTDDSALTDFVTNTYAQDLLAIETQMDKKAETWYQDTDPSTAWTDAKEKLAHVGDIWYDTSANGGNKTYIWRDRGAGQSNRFYWAEQAVPDVVFDNIDKKAAIYVSWEGWVNTATGANELEVRDLLIPSQDISVTIGDVQYNYYANKVYRCTNASTPLFEEISYTDDSALLNFINNTYAQDLAGIETQIDRKAETWYQDEDPSLSTSTPHWTDADENHVGDIWYDTSANGGKKTYIWRDRGAGHSPRYYWAEQAVPDVVFDELDGKAAIYVSWNAWIVDGVSQLNAKDLFIPSQNVDVTISGVQFHFYANKVYRCTNPSTPTFEQIAYTDDSGLNALIERYARDLTDINNNINAAQNTADSAAALAAAMEYLTQAIGQDTQTIGGLILTTTIGLRDSNNTIWSGINGAYQTAETGTGYKGHGIAAWYGGRMIDGEVTDINGQAKSLFRFDGSGYVAGKNISWDASGNVTIRGNVIDATTLQMGGSNVVTEGTLANYYTKTEADERYVTISYFNRLFQAYSSETIIDANKVNPNDLTTTISNIKSMVGFWTESYLSCLGLNASGGSGGGLDEDAMWTALWNDTGTYGGRQINESHLTYVLGDYATKAWVQQQISGGGGGGGTVTGISVNSGNPISPVNGIVPLTNIVETTGATMTGTLSITGNSSHLSVGGNIGNSGNITSAGNITGASIIKTGGTSAQFLKADGSVDSSTYLSSVPLAATGTIGGIKVKAATAATPTLAAGSTADRYYGLQIGGNGVAFVNVPWTDSGGTDTTNTAGLANLTGTKLFLVGGSSQTDGIRTYSNVNCYIGTDNCLYSNGSKVLTSGNTVQTISINGGTPVSPTNGNININCVTSVTSSTVTTALGFTPAASSDLANYLPLSGGTLTAAANSDTPLYLKSTSSNYGSYIGFQNNNTILGWYGFNPSKKPIVYEGSTPYYTIHSGNISDYETKNTAGAENLASTKLFFIGAKAQNGTPVTYSNTNCYIGADNSLYSNGKRVLTSAVQTISVNGATPIYPTNGNVNINCLTSSGTFWGQSLDSNGNVSGTITSTNFTLYDSSSNPYLNLPCGGTNWYVQSLSNGIYIGSTSSKSLVVNSSGDVGIGTTSPSYKLDVVGNVQFGANSTYKVRIGSSSSTASISMVDSGGTSRAVFNIFSDYLKFGVAAIPAVFRGSTIKLQYGSSSTVGLYMGSDGKVGIGTESPSYKLHVGGNFGVDSSIECHDLTVSTRSGSTGSASIATDLTVGSHVYVKKIGNGMTNMQFNSNGNVGIGVTNTSGYLLQVNGACAGTSWTNLSDMRQKNYIEDKNIELWQVANAPLFKFTWKNKSFGTDLHIGSSAQYWQTIAPEAVTTDGLGILGLQYDVVALLAAITTAKKVQDHENRIQALERENAALRNELRQLRAA